MEMSAEYGPFGRVVLLPPEDRPTKARRDGPDDGFGQRLSDSLLLMVPTCILDQRNATAAQLEAIRTETRDLIAHRGDVLQYGGKGQGAARVALPRALALLARTEGGVTTLGIHACLTPPPGCPGEPPNSTPETEPADVTGSAS
jgi:hypothetical protein